MDKDYYHVLGVERQTDDKEIKKAYRRLARKYHPDINPVDKGADSHFKEINEAYKVLSDPAKRKLYDRFGADWESASRFGADRGRTSGPRVHGSDSAGGSAGDFGSLFETLFSGRGRASAAPRVAKGEDVEHKVTVTFAEAYQGTTRTLDISLNEECPQCHGKGGEVKMCPECNGTGTGKQRKGFFGSSAACERCHGTGELREKMCARCAGPGTVQTQKKLEVRIPPGVRQGQRIRLANQGAAGIRGGPRGDLYLNVHVLSHPLFGRDNDDLTCEIPVTFAEAALGAEINVPTMTSEVKMKIPSGTQSGQVFRLAGKGMPKVRKGNDGTHGDELIKVKIVTPRTPTPRETELIRQLAALRDENPRANLPK